MRDHGSWIVDGGYRTFSDHFSNLLETTLLYNILKTTIILFIFNKLLLIVCCLLLLLLLHVYFVTRLNSMIVDHPFICSLILSFHSRFLSIHHLLRSYYFFFHIRVNTKIFPLSPLESLKSSSKYVTSKAPLNDSGASIQQDRL